LYLLRKGISAFYAMFYVTINAASFGSFLITPVLRTHFGYFVAFIIPAILLFISIIVLLSGSQSYIYVPPQGNVLGDLWPALK
jgi:dipeptide/tripeptide permease